MKYLSISILSLTFMIAPFFQGKCFAESKNNATINLIRPSEPQKQSTDDLREVDVTRNKTRLGNAPLDNVRALEGLEDSESIAKPPSFTLKEREESPSAKALLRAKLNAGQQEEGLVSFKAPSHQAMVRDLGDGTFEVDPDFEGQIPTLIDMNKLAYAIGKRGTVGDEYDTLISKLKLNLQGKGWAIEEFEGKTGKGNKTNDTPGFVAYNKKQNIMTVIIRGSQTREDAEGSPDWEVNFDAALIDFPKGKVHGGFYNRTTAMLPNIQKAMNHFIDPMGNEEKSKVKIIVSGHSQGAALASILMPLLVETYKANGKFGRNFNNAKSNVFRGYFISSPRVYSGEKALNWVNKVSGPHNMIRQNVTGSILADPVPILSPGRTMTALISLIPFAGEGLAKKYGGDLEGTRSVGYLAADWSSGVLTRQLGNDSLSLAARRAKGYFWNRWDILVDAAKKPWHLLTFATQKKILSQLFLEPVKDSLSTLVAPLHYGSTNSGIEAGEGLFKTDLVAGYTSRSPTMSDLLAQGFKKKKSEREGISGFIRGGIERAARIKADLPELSAVASGIKTKVSRTVKKVSKGLKSAFAGFKKKLFWR